MSSESGDEKAENSEKILLFNRWSFDGVEVKELGLKRYVKLEPSNLPHSSGIHEHHRFGKAELNIAERLTNNLMHHGISGGKKIKAINILKIAFEIIYQKTGRNPIEVLVRAVENSAPCEDTTRIGYGGIVYHKAVDIAPQRRVDIALRLLADGARQASSGSSRTIEEGLANELIFASDRDNRSYAVKKRDEIERVALSSR